jgi:uncharacterized protein YqhQ
LFFLIQLFYKKIKKQDNEISRTPKEEIKIGKFIKLKKIIATTLIPILIVALYSFINWLIASVQHTESHINTFKNINNIFFEDFFMSLLLLMYCYYYSLSFILTDFIKSSETRVCHFDHVNKVIIFDGRLVNNVLIVGAVLLDY